MRKTIEREYHHKIDERKFTIEFEKYIDGVKKRFNTEFYYKFNIENGKENITIVTLVYDYEQVGEPYKFENNKFSYNNEYLNNLNEVYEHFESAISNCAINSQMK